MQGWFNSVTTSVSQSYNSLQTKLKDADLRKQIESISRLENYYIYKEHSQQQ